MALTMEQCRKLLGSTGKGLTDQQVTELKNAAIVLADLAIDDYIAKRQMKREMEKQYATAK